MSSSSDSRLLEHGTNGTGYLLGTVASAFADVEAGEKPWIVVGSFLDDWRRADDVQRMLMVEEPIAVANGSPNLRWAALLVGIVEWLYYRDGLSARPPEWLGRKEFVLSEPWFVVPGRSMQRHQLAVSPVPFRARNIFTDENVVARA